MNPFRIFTALLVLLAATPAFGKTWVGGRKWSDDHTTKKMNLKAHRTYNLYPGAYSVQLTGWTHIRNYAGDPAGILRNAHGDATVTLSGLGWGVRYEVVIAAKATAVQGWVYWSCNGVGTRRYQSGTIWMYFTVWSQSGRIVCSGRRDGGDHVHFYYVGLYKGDSCGPGSYSESGTDLDTCKTCQSGKYQSRWHSTSCSTCPSGQIHQGSRSGCSSCGTGKYESGRTSCKTCQSGKYQDGGAKTSCKACPAGQIHQSARRGCSQCGAGKYESSHTSCKNCPAGKSSAAASDHSNDCKTCAAGYYSSAGGTCKSCGSGKYSSSGWGSCKTCPANSSPNEGKTSCTCHSDYHQDGLTCTDKCTLTLATFNPGALGTVKTRAKNKAKGRRLLAPEWMSVSELGLASMGDKCTFAQLRSKRKEAMKEIAAGMKEEGVVTPAWQTSLADVAMPNKMKNKADTLNIIDIHMRMSKLKFNKNQDGKKQCEEADVDLRNAGAYDIMMDLIGDEALACVGKRPVSKLVKKTSTTYDKYCWNGNPAKGSWGQAGEVQEGDEYTCGNFDFFVESMAVVSDGATDAPTLAPTLAPTKAWFLMEYNGSGKAVQCAGDDMIQCASDDGTTCNVYTGTAWGPVGTNDDPVVSNDNPIVLNCPGWISADGKDACDSLDCYGEEVEASQLSGGLTPVYTTDYNMGISDADAVYKCNHGHRKCSVCTADARHKFVEVVPADMPDNLIFSPAESFSANATDGFFFVEGNYVVYKTADTRLEHRIPFAHPAQK